ncbi:SO2930 family diheme c-type cytochrome [Runella sp.]|uniref:SO2930 family diheme c-type cytochrome n=1 Tax=Runella sp. TaxID=1960881 RepID=UPI003D0DC34A
MKTYKIFEYKSLIINFFGMKIFFFACFVFAISIAFSFRRTTSSVVLTAVAPKENLSEYGFFQGKMADHIPAEGVIPYALNTPLFSDYAEKLRFVKLPAGKTVAYNFDRVLDFPVGTTIIKTFYYPNDFRNPGAGRRILETRLLVHEETGWRALEYIWNDAQTDAYLEVAGETKEISWVHTDGKKRTIQYTMPNLNQCKGCHNRNEQLQPIGPSARQLNGDFQYGVKENQLVHWQKAGILTGMPAITEIPKAPVWNDAASGSLDARARAWLDINCAHCHRSEGPAKTSGLLLNYDETDLTKLGVMKAPVAAGRGSGGRQFGIVPGQPEKSILLYRLESTDPGEMMPELGRKTTHTEGVALVREWIKSLKVN